MRLLLCVVAVAIAGASTCLNGPCFPGNEFCGAPFENAPSFHLMDQHGCAENDPNGPVFDPVHGVVHHFYQIHLAAAPGHGPDYGHFVSKDFVHWAALPVAIWNGLDSSVWPPRVTTYDDQAIFTGSAVIVDGAGPDGKGPGVVNIYPGLCSKDRWPSCETGTLLAQAVPADYAGDELLTNWTKPSYNPIMENTQRDPSTPWQTPSGEWRLRTFDSKVYGAASSADMLAGKWYEIGSSADFRQCECPSFYPLPAATPGFEEAYEVAAASGSLPTHVHKTSCGGDWWQLGDYVPGEPKTLGSFNATPGWEDLFQQRKIDVGNFYASKDNAYPAKGGGPERRINWGWATVPPQSAQTLPREITFNAAARTLEQAPIRELEDLRAETSYSWSGVELAAGEPSVLDVPDGVMKQSEILAQFSLPEAAATFGIQLGAAGVGPAVTPIGTYMEKTDLPGDDYSIFHLDPGTDPAVCSARCSADPACAAWTYVIRGEPAGSGDCCLKKSVPCPVTNSGAAPSCTSGAKHAQNATGCGGGGAASIACTVEYVPSAAADDAAGFYEVPVSCGDKHDTLRMTPAEKTLELRIFSDATFIEAYFQGGRVAITAVAQFDDSSGLVLTASGANVTAESVTAYPMDSIWVLPEEVRSAERVYN